MSVRVAKRDGRVEPFDQGKVFGAVRRCFANGLRASDADASLRAAQVAQAVANIVNRRGEDLGVEDVQRLVIQQLWAQDHFEAAEHYTLYRERRRLERARSPADPGAAGAVAEDAAAFPTPLQYFQFLDKYARWSPERGRRETWRECCDRVMGWFRKQPQLAAVTPGEWEWLDGGLYGRRASCAMRVIQMAGPALDRCNTGAFNCSYLEVDCIDAFVETLYLLMQGCGVGFSVEAECVDRLPRVKKQGGGPARKVVIPDTTEGWCDAYREGLRAWFSGEDVEYDPSLVRPEGAPLRTKGGRASGPGPLMRLLSLARTLILRRQGKRLTTADAHHLQCMTGKIVQVGGVRRASGISLSDLDDAEMRDIKSGNWWESSPWLDMANNSAVYDGRPDAVTFLEEWLALAKSGSGERGVFNRAGALARIPKRRKKARFGLNPCGEILLRSSQFCNLSIAVARADDTPESLAEKVRLAAFFGTLQSTLTDFRYVRPVWKQNTEEERLLGVDVTGQMDCPLLRPGAPGRTELARRLRDVATRTNAELAARLGIPASAAVTCVKPSGNSAAFFGCSSGLHPRFGKYQVRRVRLGRANPLARLLADEGVPHATDPLNESLLVFDFLPDPAPEGTPTRHDLTAVEQFRNWLFWKENYTDHNPSCTIYVGPGEWLDLGAEVYRHFDQVGGLSFLPRDNGAYRLAPNEELTREEYEARRAAFPSINWAKLVRYEDDDHTTAGQEPACAGGACEL